MNARISTPTFAKGSKATKRSKISKMPRLPRRRRSDQEFLPAALEILETPPSPVGIALLWIICLMVVAALSWAYFGRLDVVAVAQGKIQPTGRVKVIQPIDPGRVTAVHVENGAHVVKGEELVAFDSSDADADVKQLTANRDAYRAEADRRRVALTAAQTRTISPIPPIGWTFVLPDDVKTRETNVLKGDLGQLSTTVAGLEAQVRQKRFEQERFSTTLDAQQNLVATLQQRVDMRSSLKNSGSGSKADLIDAVETLQDQTTQFVTTKGQLAESGAAIDVLAQEIERSYDAFAAENLQKLADAQRQADDFDKQLQKAELRQRRTVLTSPIDGTVSALSITTVGQVVGAGEDVMRIVPTGAGPDGIEIECYIANRDIGFIRPGQEAIVKIESLPFTRYGTIDAKLIRVASDAIPQPDAERTEGNPTQGVQQDRGFAGAQRTQNLVFPATLRPLAMSLMADGAPVPLSAGMAVTVEIKTGSRSILEYLFSPLMEVASEAMKER